MHNARFTAHSTTLPFASHGVSRLHNSRASAVLLVFVPFSVSRGLLQHVSRCWPMCLPTQPVPPFVVFVCGLNVLWSKGLAGDCLRPARSQGGCRGWSAAGLQQDPTPSARRPLSVLCAVSGFGGAQAVQGGKRQPARGLRPVCCRRRGRWCCHGQVYASVCHGRSRKVSDQRSGAARVLAAAIAV